MTLADEPIISTEARSFTSKARLEKIAGAIASADELARMV